MNIKKKILIGIIFVYSLALLNAANVQIVLDDNILAFKNKPNGIFHVQDKQDSKIIYDVYYKTDKYGRRFIPVSKIKTKKFFVLFLGCSFAFGHGLNDNETLPYYFDLMSPKYRAYNYGVDGYGANHVLAFLENHSFDQEITERTGVGFYVFMEDHVNRAIGTSEYLARHSSSAKSPYYKLIQDVPVYSGSFLAGRKFITELYQALNKVSFLKKIGIQSFPRIRAKHYEYTAKLIKKMNVVYRKQFGNDNFYVVIHPFCRNDSTIIKYLEKYNIKYIDLRSPRTYAVDYKIPMDGHPNAKLNRLLAGILISFINKMNL